MNSSESLKTAKVTFVKKTIQIRITSASIEKENNSQQKHDQIRNLKYHNWKKQEMSTFQKSIFSNAVARKKRKWSSLLIVY